jgi:hypothetical protein
VSFGGNQRRTVYDLAISDDLARKPQQRIGLGLDLKSADVSVDDRDIYARRPMIEPELVDDQRVRAATCMTQQMLVRGTPNIHVFEGPRHVGRDKREGSSAATVRRRSSAYLTTSSPDPRLKNANSHHRRRNQR